MAERSVRVRVSAITTDFNRAMLVAGKAARGFANDLDTADSRLGNIVQTGLALGPALVPITAVAVPAVAGLAAGLGFAAVGAGVTAIAFQGMGDALTALNEHALNPTEQSLAKLEEAMNTLGPAGQEFARALQELRPQMQQFQNIAQEGLFPGMAEGLDELVETFPIFENIVKNVSTALGQLSADAGASLNDPFWQEFFTFIATDASSALEQMGHAIGNVAQGFAGMFMAFDPLADDFGDVLLKSSEDFARWGAELGQSQGFREFTDYIRSVGPQVGETLGSLGSALLELAKAAAPVGDAVLPVIQAIADLVGVVAGSSVGPTLILAAAGLSAISRSIALFKIANASALVGMLGHVGTQGKHAARGAGGAATAFRRLAIAGAGLVALQAGAAGIRAIQEATDDAVPGINELTNRILDLSEHQARMFREGGGGDRSWLRDIGSEFDDLDESIRRITDKGSLEAFGDTLQTPFEGLVGEAGSLRRAKADVEALDQAFAGIVEAEGVDVAATKFEALATATGLTPIAVENLLSVMPQYKEAIEGAGRDSSLAAEGIEEIGITAQRTAAQAQDLADEIQDLNDILSGRGAMRDYEEALDAVGQSIKDNGRTLDITNEKGRANEAVLDDIAASAISAAEDMGPLERVEFLQGAAKRFEDTAVAMGMPRTQARALTSELFTLNDIDPTVTVKETGTKNTKDKVDSVTSSVSRMPKSAQVKILAQDSATPTINDVLANLRGLDGFVARVTIATRRIESGTFGPGFNARSSAEGNLFSSVRHFDMGDVADAHQPQIAPAGAWRVWAEPETGGEAYIPLADDHRRARATDIWEQTGKLLGVNFVRMAHGGMFANGGMAGGDLSAYIAAINKLADAEAALAAAQRRHAKFEALTGRIEDAQDAARRSGWSDAAIRRRNALQRQLARTYGSVAQEAERLRRAEEGLNIAQGLQGQADIFGGFATPASAQRQVDQAIKDIAAYGNVIARLKAKGASGWILAQIASKAQSGDFRSAIRLGEALLKDPEALSRLNASSELLKDVSSQVGAFQSDPRFFTNQAFNPTGAAPKIVQVNLAADPNAWLAEIKRQITFEVKAELAKGAS